jgi:hypothetical protein
MTETMDYKQMPADVLLNITSGSPASALADGDLTEVLFDQFGYLIELSDQERQSFERVKAILLGTFQARL